MLLLALGGTCRIGRVPMNGLTWLGMVVLFAIGYLAFLSLWGER